MAARGKPLFRIGNADFGEAFRYGAIRRYSAVKRVGKGQANGGSDARSQLRAFTAFVHWRFDVKGSAYERAFASTGVGAVGRQALAFGAALQQGLVGFK